MGINDEIIRSLHPQSNIPKSSNAFSTPPVTTPPRSATPPLIAEKGGSERNTREQNGLRNDRGPGGSTSNLIDPHALKKALKEFEEAGRHRDLTPGGSPSRKRQRVYGDR